MFLKCKSWALLTLLKSIFSEIMEDRSILHNCFSFPWRELRIYYIVCSNIPIGILLWTIECKFGITHATPKSAFQIQFCVSLDADLCQETNMCQGVAVPSVNIQEQEKM